MPTEKLMPQFDSIQSDAASGVFLAPFTLIYKATSIESKIDPLWHHPASIALALTTG